MIALNSSRNSMSEEELGLALALVGVRVGPEVKASQHGSCLGLHGYRQRSHSSAIKCASAATIIH